LPDAETLRHEHEGGESVKTDSEGNTCPFCPENGFVIVIDETELAYLVQVVKSIDGERITQVGRYFIIPKQHMESILERPDDWTKHEKILLWRAIITAGDDQLLMQLMEGRELTDALNTSWNNGKWAGQLVLHSHLWVIFRYDSLQIGLDSMIIEVCDSRNNQDARALATGGEKPYHEPDDPQY
jgi:hypothetical protein